MVGVSTAVVAAHTVVLSWSLQGADKDLVTLITALPRLQTVHRNLHRLFVA